MAREINCMRNPRPIWLVKYFMPSSMWHVLQRLGTRWPRQISTANLEEMGEERSSDWYDLSFDHAPHWKSHFTESRYYALWSLIADRIVRSGKTAVLDIGCGPGQFADLIRDRGIRQYCGLDFSSKRIQRARLVCPDFEFISEDAYESSVLDTFPYDSVVMTEFLEHVEGDLEILQRVRPGTHVYGSVPNFPYTSHVRYFTDVESVYRRYSLVLQHLRIERILADSRGRSYFLLEGIRA
jgi:2-polyprenyl-3-methyl-5-hydroxy-6-metoxy-1,4-benzoquinol methylase